MYPILFGKLDPSKAAQCNHDTASSGAVVGRSDPSTLDGRSSERAADVVQALADFGVPKSKRGARNHVVNNRAAVSRTGRETAIQNLASDEWRPRFPATRRLDERVPFAHALSGYDPDRVADEDYPWSVP